MVEPSSGGVPEMSSSDRGDESSCKVSVKPMARGSAADELHAVWWHRLAEGNSDAQLQTLIEIGRSTRVLGVSDLVTRLAGSRDDSVRAAAAQALEHALQPSLVELPALIVSLSDHSDGEISYWAATLLGRLGKKAVDAVPALCDCLTSSSFLAARERAVWALQEIGPGASESIPVLRAASESAPARLQQLCRDAISAIGKGDCLHTKQVA